MYLQKIALHNFRCFEDVEIDFHEKLTVLVGGNGSGKTSILEGVAIAIGAYFRAMDDISAKSICKSDAYMKAFPMGSNEDVQSQYPVNISADSIMGEENQHIHWSRSLTSPDGKTTIKDAKEMTNISKEYQERVRSGDSILNLPLIAYYGTGRLWDYHREKRVGTLRKSNRINGYIDCLDGTANIKLMMDWFKKMTVQRYQRLEENGYKLPELDTVYQALEKCVTSITGYDEVKVQYNLNTNDLDIYYIDEAGMRMRMPLSQMSDGYKGMISLIADIAYRMANLNPQLLNRILEETTGVVLVDEIDLHLHPAWQQSVLENLMSIFPKIQFIVTTHAPEVINSVSNENLVILENYQTKYLQYQTYGKDVASVLSEVMRVNERPQKLYDLFQEFYQKLSEKDFDAAEQSLDLIDELRDHHDPEVARCRVTLKLERMRGAV